MIPSKFLTVLTFLLLRFVNVRACTAVLVGRDASEDGSVIVTHSDDGEGDNDPRVMLVPPYKNGEHRDIMPDTEDFPRYVGFKRGPYYEPHNNKNNGDGTGTDVTVPIGKLKLSNSEPETLAYFDGNYGVINSKQVITGGESTCSGVFSAKALPEGKALFSINELSRVALERTSSAREAVQLMGDLAEQYGFYGASGSFEGSAETLLVADPNEGFVFHILPDDTGASAIWVAQRCPDDEVTVVANMFTIREVNLTDTFNFMGSQYMFEVAKRNKMWSDDDGKLLDFTRVFSDGEYAHKYYSGRRMWGAFRLISPSSNFDPDYEHDLRLRPAYPWSVKPDKKLSINDVFDIHRTYYKGTKYDLSLGLAAGPFGNPDRFTEGKAERALSETHGKGAWERPIALFRTTYTTVIQARSWLPDAIGGVMWLGPHAAHGTCFIPFSIGVNALPDSIVKGRMDKLDRASAFWTFRYIHSLTRLRYSDLSRIVAKAQATWETKALELQKEIENEFAKGSTYSVDALTNKYFKHTSDVLKAWWELADEMVFAYSDGFDYDTSGAPALGYSSAWLKSVGYLDGPPKPTMYGLHPPSDDDNKSNDSPYIRASNK